VRKFSYARLMIMMRIDRSTSGPICPTRHRHRDGGRFGKYRVPNYYNPSRQPSTTTHSRSSRYDNTSGPKRQFRRDPFFSLARRPFDFDFLRANKTCIPRVVLIGIISVVIATVALYDDDIHTYRCIHGTTFTRRV